MHKYTRVARGQDGKEVMNMMDLELTKKDIMRNVQDLRTVRAVGRALSCHHIVLCKIRLMRTRIMRREVVNGAMRIRSEELRGHQYMEG